MRPIGAGSSRVFSLDLPAGPPRAPLARATGMGPGGDFDEVDFDILDRLIGKEDGSPGGSESRSAPTRDGDPPFLGQ